jgi:hypothetical protein
MEISSTGYEVKFNTDWGIDKDQAFILLEDYQDDIKSIRECSGNLYVRFKDNETKLAFLLAHL